MTAPLFVFVKGFNYSISSKKDFKLSRGMKNVISSIDEISMSAEKNASATQETAASMEQMTSSMEEVASSAQKLSDMAVQLREHVGKFKVGSERVLEADIANNS